MEQIDMKTVKVAAKPAVKISTPKPVAKKSPAKKVAAKPAPQPTAAATIKAPEKKTPARKPSAPKAVSPIVRDSFTMTAADQELLKKCKRDAVISGRDSTKKSEIVRAALRHFASLSAATQLMELNGLDPVKTGRPNKKK
jgi:outer membrane biosynthesis protein TonB